MWCSGSSAPQSPSAGGWPWPACWRWWSSSAPWRGPTLLGDLIQVLYDCWAGAEVPGGLAASLVPGILALLGIYAVQSLFTYLKMLLMNNVVSRHFTCDLRIAIADKFQRLPVSFVDDTPVGEILQRMTDDVSRMGNTVHEIVDTMMTGFLQIAAISVVMLLEDWRLALLVIVLMPLSIRLSALVASRSNGYFRRCTARAAALHRVEEHYTNYATTKAYNMEEMAGSATRRSTASRRRRRPGQLPGGAVQPVIASPTPWPTSSSTSWGAGWWSVRGGGGHRHDHRPLRPPDRRSSGADRQRHEQHPARHRGGRAGSTPSWTGRRRPPSPVPAGGGHPGPGGVPDVSFSYNKPSP